jgi:cytochrome c553
MPRRRVPVFIIVLVVAGLALLSSALVMAADSPASPRTITAQLDMPGASGAELLDYILNQNPYTDWGTWTADRWNDYAGYLPSGAPHGETVRIFVNDVALEAANGGMFEGTLPAGSIVVKENFGGTPDMPGDVAALTVMYKIEGFNPEGGDWFWLKAAPDGSVIDAEGMVEGCQNCHAQEGNVDYQLRYGFGAEPAFVYGEPLPEATGAALADYIFNVSPYTEWGSWPMQNMDDFGGYLASQSPHGTTVRIFVNDRGVNALDRSMPDGYPYGTIVVKEGYDGTPDMPGDVTGLSIMYKVEGFNPEGGDWFWLSTSADGSTVNAEGLVEGCQNCHGGLADQDYVMRFNYHQYHDEMMGEMGGETMMVDGNAVIDAKCTVCHTRDRIDAAEKDRAGWEATVDRMIGYGADLTAEERQAVIDFLAERDSMGGETMMIDGNAVIYAKCTVCHTRDRIDAAEKDRAGWEATVDRMISNGANLTAEEREAVLDFLAGGM